MTMIAASKLAEIKIFEDLLDTPENSLVKKAIAAGRLPIGYSCDITPVPLFMVGNAFPVRLRAPGVGDTMQADYFLSLMICTYARSLLQAMLDGKYDFLKAVIGGAGCTHINRCEQHLVVIDSFKKRIDEEKFPFHILDAPRKVCDGTLELYTKDMKDMAAKLTDSLGLDYSDASIRKAIKELNRFKALLKKVSNFRKGPEPRITGTEFHKVMVASHLAPKDMLIEPLEALIKALEKRKPVTGYRARVMITGTIFDNPAFTELVEAQGALVVADRYCFGSLPGLEPIPEDGDPWENLTKYYTDTCECARMMEKFEERYQSRLNYMKEFDVDGIIIQTLKFCDTWAYETPMNLDRLHAAQIPVVKIEHEYQLNSEGQIRTRVQAFVESIESKRQVAQ